jgi:molybdate transport system substrate-binding protein
MTPFLSFHWETAMNLLRVLSTAVVSAALGLAASAAWADDVPVAVAANFTAPAKEIAAAFEKKSSHHAVLSFGATGGLYTQITQDAPFEVFLAADEARPKKAVADGFAVADSLFVYAVGKLVLWSKSADAVKDQSSLKAAGLNKIAICNPTAAPYGAAAVATLQKLGLYDALKPKLVEGADITQAYQFVDSGNAEVGFVALSQLAGKSGGSRWVVPQDLYPAIKQDAVLLKKGAGHAAARAFLEFLQGPEAHEIIERYGYDFDKHS